MARSPHIKRDRAGGSTVAANTHDGDSRDSRTAVLAGVVMRAAFGDDTDRCRDRAHRRGNGWAGQRACSEARQALVSVGYFDGHHRIANRPRGSWLNRVSEYSPGGQRVGPRYTVSDEWYPSAERRQ